MKKNRKSIFVVAVFLAGGLISTYGQAHVLDEHLSFADQLPVSDNTLSHMRGGFSTRNGNRLMEIKFGIEELSFVNGVLTTESHFHFPLDNTDIDHVDTGDMMGNVVGREGNISGNIANSFPGLGSILQNDLDNQTIQHLRVLDVDIHGSQFFHSTSINQAIQSAIQYLPGQF